MLWAFLTHLAHISPTGPLEKTLQALTSSAAASVFSHENLAAAELEAAAMVLARKKLKQKLHTLLPAGEAEVEEAHGEEVQAVKERLASSKRPRPKRPPRKKSLPEVVLQTEEERREEVERRKEKRRIRRLMEAEAAAATQQLGGEMGAEAEGKEEASEEDDPSVGPDQPVVAENR